MTDTRTYTIAELEQFFMATESTDFKATNRIEAYQWLQEALYRYGYAKRSKPDKSILRSYFMKMTGSGPAQLTRLIRQWTATGHVCLKDYQRHRFNSTYTKADIVLLAAVDEAHSVLSGPATRTILEREFRQYGKSQFERLSQLSVSHLYNLRHTMTYRQKLLVYTKTQGTKVTIGERRKPDPNGEPGYVRVDSVHQGDCPTDGKGVYHINFVDEVTQWEIVACVETISERHMTPVLVAALEQFPFTVLNFHSDNGSEYINKVVARLLEKLRIDQTKSRPRQHNDNALVETKNGSVVRKHMGYDHIIRSDAAAINAWYLLWFNDYLNYHRPSGYGTVKRDQKGKEKIVYRKADYMVPYEKFKSLPESAKFLKKGVTFDQLDKTAYAMSDTDFAVAMMVAKEQLFSNLKK